MKEKSYIILLARRPIRGYHKLPNQKLWIKAILHNDDLVGALTYALDILILPEGVTVVNTVPASEHHLPFRRN